MSRYGETCVLNRHRCPYAHQNNHYTRSRSRSRSRSRGRRRERSRSRGRYNSNIYGHHRRKRKPAQESVIDRHRKELEEISATGAIELWGLSPREPPADCDDEATKMALPADRMKRTRESESESEEDSSEEKKKKKKHKKCSKKKLRKSHYKKKSKKHHKKVHQMSSSESDDESDEEDTDMESQESWIEKQKDKDKEGGNGVIGPLPLMQDAGNQDITERHVITNSATPVCCNKGKDNFARLCCAFIEVGTLVLTKISEKVCSQKKLDSRLKDDTILKELTSLRMEKVLSGSQWIKLYPLRRSSSVSFRDFDPPLQLLLLRSIFGLNFTASGQDSFPPATDISPVAGLTCLKVLRDRIHRHDAIGSVDDPTFNSYWSDMKIIFVRFGGRCCLDTIRYLEVYCLEEDLGEEYRKQLREWMRDDVSTEDKLGEEPKHGGAAENAKIGPPELSIHISKISELPKDFSGWESGRLPVDILLFTVEEVEFLSCYVFLKNPIKSYHIDIGVVYFSSMEDKQGHKVKIALMRCSKVHDGPGGALSAAKDAILLLRPKALFSVGTCRGIESTTIKPGDVIVSSKVITLDFKIPPRRHCLKLLGHLAAGWTPPLRNANEYEVKVHPGALISIPKVNEDIIRQYSEAIGLDKDGGGISTAANDLGTEWLIVKGIEDFKNDSQSSNNKWKEFASLMAASLVAKLLSDPFIFQDWPRLNAPSAFR